MTLSVLITYFNERSLLTECLASLAGGSSRPDEILIYDDASMHPAADHLVPDLPVRVIRGSVNRGPAYGRNQLLNEATGDLVHFHDADDAFASDWCHRVRETFASEAVDCVFTEASSFRDNFDDRNFITDQVFGLRELSKTHDLLAFCILHPILPAAATYRRLAVTAVGGYSTTLWQSEDYDFHLRLAMSGVLYRLILEPLARIRVRSESRSNERVRVYLDAIKSLKQALPVLPPGYHPFVGEALNSTGIQLYRVGARAEAKEVFQLALQFGTPSVRGARPSYRTIARLFGLPVAEAIGALFRAMVPEPLRRRGRAES